MVISRTYKQRWHLFRNMLTQLIEHERIYTTKAKAHLLRKYAQRIIKHSKRSAQGIPAGKLQVNRYLTTELAKKKATLELAARYKDQICNFTRISGVQYRRRGDNAPVVSIEYKGNEYEKFEAAKREERKKDPKIVDLKSWKKKILLEQKQFLEKKLSETPATEQSSNSAFLQAKLKQLDFELKLEGKERKTPPMFREFL